MMIIAAFVAGTWSLGRARAISLTRRPTTRFAGRVVPSSSGRLGPTGSLMLASGDGWNARARGVICDRSARAESRR